MLLEDLLPQSPNEPQVPPLLRVATLGAMLHREEEGPSLVQRLNALRAEKNAKNAPPPEPARPPYWKEMEAQAKQEEDDRFEMAVRIRERRLRATDTATINRLDEAERQLIHGDTR
jgi:hypothetical protein